MVYGDVIKKGWCRYSESSFTGCRDWECERSCNIWDLSVFFYVRPKEQKREIGTDASKKGKKQVAISLKMHCYKQDYQYTKLSESYTITERNLLCDTIYPVRNTNEIW